MLSNVKIVDLKRDKKEKTEEAAERSATASSQPDYGYGTCLHLEDHEIEKLGITDLPAVGTQFYIVAMATVKGVNERDYGDRKEAGMDLQITAMGLSKDAPKDGKTEEKPRAKPARSALSNSYSGGYALLVMLQSLFTFLFIAAILCSAAFGQTSVTPSTTGTSVQAKSGTWVPTTATLTVVGTPTYTGTYLRILNRVFVTLTVSATTSTASTKLTTLFGGLPYSIGIRDVCMTSDDSGNSYGNGLVDTGGGAPKIFTPTWSASAGFFTTSCSYVTTDGF